VEEEPRAWYAAGLYRRIQERRRWQPKPAPRIPWRQRLRERGLHWSVELVVGVFVAVIAASLITVAFASGSGSMSLAHLQGTGSDAGAAGGGAAATAAPTPDCIAAPIAASTKRVCTH
jgi:hypothetical protein